MMKYLAVPAFLALASVAAIAPTEAAAAPDSPSVDRSFTGFGYSQEQARANAIANMTRYEQQANQWCSETGTTYKIVFEGLQIATLQATCSPAVRQPADRP